MLNYTDGKYLCMQKMFPSHASGKFTRRVLPKLTASSCNQHHRTVFVLLSIIMIRTFFFGNRGLSHLKLTHRI